MSSFRRDHEEKKAIQFMVYDNSDDSKFSFRFKSDVLKEILTKKEVADLPIAIYSVAGKLRTGKSFLLNLFVHLLQSGTLNHKNLDLYQPSFGFPWRGGSAVHTNGMWIIDEPFIFQKPDGTKFALFLMDTEGTDEPGKSSNTSNVVFSMSTLLSSFQIFNIKYPFSGEELKKLHLCSSMSEQCTKIVGYLQEAKTFAKGLKSSVVNSIKDNVHEKNESKRSKSTKNKFKESQEKKHIAPFQSLMFLIRDNPAEDIEERGGSFQFGKDYLKTILCEKDNEAEEVRAIRKHIMKAFNSVDCCVVQSPGKKAADRGQNPKSLEVKDLDQDFFHEIKNLFDHLFDQENIVIKKINGQPLTCSLFFEYTQLILSLYKSGKVPQAVDVIQKVGKNYIKESDLKEFHEKFEEGVMSEIQTIQCLGSEKNRMRHIEEFQRDLENLWNFKKQQNEILRIKLVQDIYKISDGVAKEHKSNLKKNLLDTTPLSKEGFEISVDSETEKSMKKFEEQTAKYKHYNELLEEPSHDLKKKINVANDSLTLKNSYKLESVKLSFETAENELTQEYEQAMEKRCYEKPLEPAQFLGEHKEEKRKIFEKFDKNFEDISESFKNVYRSKLRTKISEKKNHYENLNVFYLENQQNKSALRTEIENFYRTSMDKRLRGVYRFHEEFETIHEESTNDAFKYAERRLDSTFDVYRNALSDTFDLFKKIFRFSNDNIRKTAQAHFKKQMEICYKEYNFRMKKMLKEDYDAEIEKKHEQCKDEAIHMYDKEEGEPEEDFLSTKSHLKEKIQKRLDILKRKNASHKAEEDRNEEEAWKYAIFEFERKMTEAIKKNKSKTSEAVEKDFCNYEKVLLKEYKNKVVDRFVEKEEELKEKFQSIFDEIPESSPCVIL